MPEPLVSVVIPVYNAVEHLEGTLASVFSQSYENLEIIAVDDSSTDGSADILRRHESRVHSIRRENGGPAAARNSGIRAANGEWVAFLDADDQWLPDKISAQMAVVTKDPTVGLVHTQSITMGAESAVADSEEVHTLIEQPATALPRLLQGNFISTSSVLCKRSALFEVGLFDEDLRFFAVEDYDLWLRISAKFPIALIPKGYSLYRVHEEGISKNIDRSYVNERNVLDKWFASNKDSPLASTSNKKKRFKKLYHEWSESLSWAGNSFSALSVTATCALRYGPSLSDFPRIARILVSPLLNFLRRS